MAKFISCTGDLRLKDGELITFGDGLDSNLWWDGAAGELRLDTTISGVDPTQSYHLTTKYYVDEEIATLSGSIILDHGNLTGLGDDDHTQYILVDGSRGFTGTVSGIDPTQSYHLTTRFYVDNEIATLSGIIGDHGNLQGLSDDDHTQYILVNGTRAFTSTVGGVTPTQDEHLTTKQYVDQLVQGLDWQDSVLGITASGVAVEGNRYISTTSSGSWTEDYIMEYTGTSWSGIEPNEGFATWVEDQDALYVYNGSDWVRFGSTVIHNNLSGLQGGTASEYYHLSSAQHSALTDAGGVGNASTQHIHDDRYYTETEMDTTLSGYSQTGHSHTSADITDFTTATQGVIGTSVAGASFVSVSYNAGSGITTISGVHSSIDHGLISGLADDDHPQYILVDGSRGFTSTVSGVSPTQDYHLTTKQYVDNAITSISGVIGDHGNLLGLTDDDHPQYVLVDGSRGFTSTVSGVSPTESYHLATKSYVDALTVSGSIDRSGITNIPNGTCYVQVSFPDIGTTNYVVNATLENTSDSPPSIYAFIITNKATNSFRVDFMGDMDSANYYLNWMILDTTV